MAKIFLKPPQGLDESISQGFGPIHQVALALDICSPSARMLNRDWLQAEA